MKCKFTIKNNGRHASRATRILKKKFCLVIVGILTCLALPGCGLTDTSSGDGSAGNTPAIESQGQEPSGSKEQPSGQGQISAPENDSIPNQPDDGYPRGSRIAGQTFDVTLRPLGQITFAAYEPDTSENSFADVVFLIERDGEILMQLSGTTEDNVGLEEFCQVEAVSFLDYNNDSYDDIIAKRRCPTMLPLPSRRSPSKLQRTLSAAEG